MHRDSEVTLRVIVIDDSESDPAPVLRALERSGYQVVFQRVETERAFAKCLKKGGWDMILADPDVPGLQAFLALDLVRASGRDIPFIIFSESLGEELAVELMKAGSNDCVPKSNLLRVVSAVASELDSARMRRLRQTANSTLMNSEARYRAIVETNSDMICRFLSDGRLTFVNSTYCRYFGKSKDELVGHVFTLLVPDEDRAAIDEMMLALKTSKRPYVHEHRVINGEGELRWNHWINSAILDEHGNLLEFQAVGRDITDRKRAEQELKRLTDELLRTQDEERRRLARELHDTTAQKLSALSLNLNYAISHSHALADKAVSALHDSLELADSCAQEIRTLSYLLHPPELDLLGLRGAINEFVKGFSRRTGIDVHFEVSPSFERLPDDVETGLFRVVQESLTNVHRHSGSDTAWIRLWREALCVRLLVLDRGRGFGL